MITPKSLLSIAAFTLVAGAFLGTEPARAATQPCVTVNSTAGFGYSMSGVTFCGSNQTYTDQAQKTFTLDAFQGIQYATADRWARPAARNYGGNADVTGYGPICPQATKSKPAQPQDEQCLYLNVWRPQGTQTGAKLPVMVFIHGGAFVFGSASDGVHYDDKGKVIADSGLYNGKRLASQGTKGQVVVTLNYRLGPLGFLTSDGAQRSYGVTIPSNLGIIDQQLALKWVQANIASFGGDPANVTLFGESAGAMSTGIHMFSVPSSKNLFDAAIMESNPMGYEYRDQDEAVELTTNFLDCLCQVKDKKASADKKDQCTPQSKIGKCSWADMVSPTKTPTADILTTLGAFGVKELKPLVKQSGLPESLPYAPAVGDGFMQSQPVDGFASGDTSAYKPYIFGFNKDEGALFAPKLAKVQATAVVVYEYLVGFIFPGYGKAIRHYPKRLANHPYGATNTKASNTGDKVQAYSYPRVGMSNLVNDFAFACGNFRSATRSFGATGNTDAIYAYYFNQPNIGYQALPRPDGEPAPTSLQACAPSLKGKKDKTVVPAEFTCHTTELPFVFGSFDGVRNVHDDPYTPSTAEVGLSETMMGAWAGFAASRDPGVSGWSPLAKGAPVAFNQHAFNTGGGTDPSVVYAKANCEGLWNGLLD